MASGRLGASYRRDGGVRYATANLASTTAAAAAAATIHSEDMTSDNRLWAADDHTMGLIPIVGLHFTNETKDKRVAYNVSAAAVIVDITLQGAAALV